jgi:hypothetical protein
LKTDAKSEREVCLEMLLFSFDLAELKPETYAMVIHDLNAGIVFQIFAKLGDKDIHASAHKIIIITPYVR